MPPRLITLQGSSRYLDGTTGSDSEAAAWLNIRTEQPCNDDMSVPLVSSTGRQGRRFYVHHKQFVRRQRLTIAKSLALIDRSVNAEALRDRMDELADKLQVRGRGLSTLSLSALTALPLSTPLLQDKLVELAVRPSWDAGRELPIWDVTLGPGPGPRRTNSQG